jgi:twitching motility protein PilT
MATAVATSGEVGGETMDQALIQLVRKGLITRENALHYAVNKDYVTRNMN